MNVIPTHLKGVLILEPKVFGDERGYFFEVWNQQKLLDAGIDCHFVQDNESKSRAGVLRGLHWQAAPYTHGSCLFPGDLPTDLLC